jgi:hypothetical protein
VNGIFRHVEDVVNNKGHVGDEVENTFVQQLLLFEGLACILAKGLSFFFETGESYVNKYRKRATDCRKYFVELEILSSSCVSSV